MAEFLLATSNESKLLHRRRLVLYVAGFVVIQIVALVGVFFLASTNWFMYHDDYPGMRQAGYGLRLRRADCDIVLYGDSSALTGLHPDAIQRITGLKTCNVSEGGTILSVVGSNWPLDQYLKYNKRPRYILMMFTPSIFIPYRPPLGEYQPEGMLYALQYQNGRDLYRSLLHRRQWILNFVIWSGHALLEDLQSRLTKGGRARLAVNTRAQREEQNGVWPYPLPPEDRCVRTAFHINPAMIQRYADSVATMRKTYAVQGTLVLINIAPVPTCDTVRQAYEKQSEGLHDNPFETMPISDFNEGDVHFTPGGGEKISVEAGYQILALEQQQQSTALNANEPKEESK